MQESLRAYASQPPAREQAIGESSRPRSILTQSDARRYPDLAPYYDEDQYKARSAEDNAAMDALGMLYRKFQTDGNAQDADNLLTHIDRYAGQAAAGRQDDPDDPHHYHDYSNGYYNSVRERNERGWFEDGYVKVTLASESTANHFEWLLYTAARSMVDYLIKISAVEGIFSTVGSRLKLPAYFKYRPHDVLQPGDVDVYYSANPSGGYGNHYYFRGNELLFVSRDGGSLVEAGPSFWNEVGALDRHFTAEDGADQVAEKILSDLWKLWLPAK